MTTQQLNRLMVYRPMKALLAAYSGIVNRIEACRELVAMFTENVDAIERAAGVQLGATAGKTDVKLQAEERLVETMSLVGGALRTYAKRNNLLETEAKATYEKWELRQLRDGALLTRAQMLLEETTAHLPNLAKYGIDEATMNRFQTAVSDFAKALGTRETGVTDRKLARTDMEALFLETDRILDEDLKAMIEFFRESDPALYDSYHQMRVTKALGAKRKSNGETPAPAAGNGEAPVSAAVPGEGMAE